MIPLIFSILSSSVIFVIFKLFEHFKIDTFQAIVFNYVTACSLGFLLYGNQWSSQHLQTPTWIPFALICATLFITLFFVMAKSSQINGVASTSIAVKMSMSISLILMMLWHNETINFLKIVGIAFAFLGVYLITSKPDYESKTNAVWMLLFLFFGSGALDFTINVVQESHLNSLSPALFSSIGFGMAGLFGIVILVFNFFTHKTKIALKNILAGCLLGIPNYFSIYLLLVSYKSTGLPDSSVLAITNVSIVILSALIGFVLFREKSTTKKLIGLISSILAIVILYFAHQKIEL